MKFWKNTKKTVSLICIVAIVLSCMMSVFGMNASAATVSLNLNNNGVITNSLLTVGDQLPTPTSDIEGNTFLGWYSDTALTQQVETVPSSSATYYAKWSTTVIDFNQIVGGDLGNFCTAVGSRAVTDGVMSCTLRATHYFTVPTYDAAGVKTFFELEDGKNYKITVTYKLAAKSSANARYFYIGLCDGTTSRGAVTQICEITSSGMTEFAEYSIVLENFTATDGQNNIYFRNNAYEAGVTYFDKIVIEELSPTSIITFNNNGTITSEKLEQGAKLPTPTSDIEGNTFLGWYTDTTWATKVETVPAADTTLYAKWKATVIDFNNLVDADVATFTDSSSKNIGYGGNARINIRKGGSGYYNFVIPAYDATGAGFYMFEEGKDYTITVTASGQAGGTYGLYTTMSQSSGATRSASLGSFSLTGTGSTAQNTDALTTHTVEIEAFSIDDAVTTNNKAAITILNINNVVNVTYIDKIVVTELPSKVEITLNNNGSVTTETLREGDALPTPESDIAGNLFYGWYVDTTWNEKVDVVPSEPTTFYAKWKKTKVGFENIVTLSGYTASTSQSITVENGNKVARLNLNNSGSYSLLIPAYDAEGAGFYKFEEGKSYKISFKYSVASLTTKIALYQAVAPTTSSAQGSLIEQVVEAPVNVPNDETVGEMNAVSTLVADLVVDDAITTANTVGVAIGTKTYASPVICFFDDIIIEEVVANINITFNNNGSVTNVKCVEGDELLVPSYDEEDNEFLGWYSDTSCSQKVESVPSADATLYAKWKKTVIDFNNITLSDIDNLATASTIGLSGGVARVRLRATHYFNLPAMDIAGTGAYTVEDDTRYKITFYYKSAAVSHSAATRYVYIGLDDGTSRGDAEVMFKLPDADMTDFEEFTYIFDANVVDGKNRLYIRNNMYDSGDIYFDKIVIENMGIAVNEGVNASSIRAESGSGDSYKSAAIRFRGVLNETDAEAATEIGFMVVPTGFTTESSLAVKVVNKSDDMHLIYSKDIDGYYEYQALIKGLTREGASYNLCDVSMDVYMYYVEDGETVFVGDTYVDSYTSAATRVAELD